MDGRTNEQRTSSHVLLELVHSLLVTAEIVGVISVIGLYELLRIFVHGVAVNSLSGSSTVETAASSAAELTTVFGVGAVIAALWVQHMGSTYLGAVKLGAGSVFAQQTGLKESDSRNPAVLVETLSRQLGEVMPRVLDAFVTSCLVTTLTLLILHHPAAINTGLHASPVATIPLVLRGFGLLASLFGLLTVRATEQENLERALLRSHVVVEVVFASATVGTLVWIVGSWSSTIAIAALVGVALPVLIANLRTFHHWPRVSRRMPTDGALNESGGLSVELLGETLKLVSLLPVAVYASVLLFAAFWQQRLGNGDSLFFVALLVGLASPSALSSWHAAPNLARGVHATAALSGSLGRIPTTDEFIRRQHRLSVALEQLTLKFETRRNRRRYAVMRTSGIRGPVLVRPPLFFTANPCHRVGCRYPADHVTRAGFSRRQPS